ncbi:sigma-70 family RNA polymerase sigma factor [Chitinophaga horti]|uniref:Sigma-70 family RNA polymerase sigma factor n=1 Tax=Chitinophaga horti TaxID=2920382 RepID=A0ABY6J102_9BACT|nr:sigma-70 family RNA polymerase sigma factor [Chitinophaga horti]UYQ91899.1 sigma-70 family RNA polymerase sigma factor [Chitinophaga horti]
MNVILQPFLMSDLYHIPDEVLWSRVTGNDEQAFAELFGRYWQAALQEAIRKTGNDADAMDCTQELFIRLWNQRHLLQVNGCFSTFLYSTLKIRIISHFRASVSRIAGSRSYRPRQAEHIGGLHKMQAKEVAWLLEAEVQRMPGRMQQIYRMSRQQFLSVQDIAGTLSLSEQTVKNQLTSALKRLRQAVAHYEDALAPLMLVAPLIMISI